MMRCKFAVREGKRGGVKVVEEKDGASDLRK